MNLIARAVCELNARVRSGSYWVRLLTLVALLLGNAVACLAQSDEWKRDNDRGNRYEGTIERAVSQLDLDLLSLTSAREKLEGDEELNVRFYLPESISAEIVARELVEAVHYWMLSKPFEPAEAGWRDFGPWPTSEVLSKNQISFDNIGVLVRVQSEQSNADVLSPAMIYHSSPGEPSGDYTFLFQPSVPLRRLDYSVYRVGADGAEILSASLGETKRAGVPFAVEIDLTGESSGLMRLELAGKYRNRTGGPVREYEFYHRVQDAP